MLRNSELLDKKTFWQTHDGASFSMINAFQNLLQTIVMTQIRVFVSLQTSQ